MYARVAAVMILAVLVRLALVPLISPDQLHAEVHGVGTFLGVVGGMYSIVIAFVIYVVWDQYNRVQSALDNETAAVEDLVRAAAMLSDRSTVQAIRISSIRYLELVAGDESKRHAAGEHSAAAHELATTLARQVRDVQREGARGSVADELLRCLARMSDARAERLAISMVRIPATMWHLVLFASAVLVCGFYCLGIRSLALSCMVVAGVSGVLAFLLSVIKDLDNPFGGVWNITYEPVRATIARLQSG